MAIKDNITIENLGGSGGTQPLKQKPETYYQVEHKPTTLKIDKEDILILYNLNTNKYIELDILPETVSASYKSRITNISPFGIIRPIQYYTGGEAKEITFSIDIHEDAQKEKNIYKLVEELQNLAKPSFTNQHSALQEPSVYLQLANQFAGKGHLSTGIGLKTPYRDGRYIYISVSFHFTYHEEFDYSQRENIFVDIIKDNKYLSGYFIDDNILNFLEEKVDVNYYKTWVQKDEKMMSFLKSYISDYIKEYEKLDLDAYENLLYDDYVFNILESRKGLYRVDEIKILRYTIDFGRLLEEAQYSNNFYSLTKSLQKLKKDIQDNLRKYHEEVDGAWISRGFVNEKAFVDAHNILLDEIDRYLKELESMYSATR